MAVIPSDIRFVGIGTQVDMTEKKTENLNALTQPYTMQDIIDTVGGGDSVMVAGPGAYAITGFGKFNMAMGPYSAVVSGCSNLAGNFSMTSGDYTFVGGGKNNCAFGNYSFIGGGESNRQANEIVAGGMTHAFIGGGQYNGAYYNHSTVVGGIGNRTTAACSSVVGGQSNQANGTHSFTGGGYSNCANGSNSFVGGGSSNTSSGVGSIIVSGSSNTSSGQFSSVVGGEFNRACTCGSFIGGGGGNLVDTNAFFSSVLGGELNNVSTSNSHAIGSGLTANVADYTFVNNLCNVGGGTSDSRLKENIQPLTFGLQELSQLEPVEYNFTADESKKTKYGFLAQNVQSVMPSLITYHPTDLVDGEPVLQFDKDAVWSSMVNALKELQERIVKLENK